MLGMPLSVNNSYASSTVTGPNPYTPLSDDSRLSHLGNPNLILVEGGTNDIYIGKSAGTWNGTDLANLDVSDFTQAYTKILITCENKYPKAKIVCVTPAYIDSAYSSDREHCTLDEINVICGAELAVCGRLGIECADMRKAGMTMHNFGEMTLDHLHWNYNFNKLAARYL